MPNENDLTPETQSSVYERLIQLLVLEFREAPAGLTPDARFIDDLDWDSLNVAEFRMLVEKAFSIVIEDDEMDEADSVEKLVALIERLTPRTNPEPAIIEDEIPTWATARAEGIQVGAMLISMDARQANGIVFAEQLGGRSRQFDVVTDDGELMRLSTAEIGSLFHPPRYVMDINRNPGVLVMRERGGV